MALEGMLNPRHVLVCSRSQFMWFLNKQGSVLSSTLCREVIQMWKWAIDEGITVSTIHIVGYVNILEESLKLFLQSS